MNNLQFSTWRERALEFERQLNRVVIGQNTVIRQVLTAVFARGHTLLEGSVGVGKTTLLRAIAQGLGGDYQRVEGTIDLMPADLIYYTYLDSAGKPHVDPGPLLKQGRTLSTFFFNEINRARPQVHSLLLRAMAEQRVNAFNQDYELPYLQVFADRNRVEREETFELPAAAKDRFMFELNVGVPSDRGVLEQLMFNPRFHDVEQLIADVQPGILPYYELNAFAADIQAHIQSTDRLRAYALSLWQATHTPEVFGIKLSDTVMQELILSGASPRGMSYLVRAAKVNAWLSGREILLPDDLQTVFAVTMQHRIFLNPMYAYRKDELLPALVNAILEQVAAP